MRFDEFWIGPAQLALTAALARSTTDLPGEVVEIGTWQGLSAIPIAHAVAPATLHVVDHWLGDGAAAVGIDPAKVERDNYGIFLANLQDARAGNVEVHKMDWREFAKEWDRPVRFLHLDATHSADEVSDNIAALLPFAADGTVFCGDDYGFPEVREGIDRQFTDVSSSEGKLWWKIIGSDEPAVQWAAHAHPLTRSSAYQRDLMQIRDMFVAY
jgi:hypothetical protein